MNLEFLQQYGPEIAARAAEHLWLSLVAVVGAVVLGVPLGILIFRVAAWRGPVLGFANIVQTMPSLALFAFLLPILGLGGRNAVAALLLYSLLPIIRNTYTGLQNVDGAAREAARAMGMTPGQILRQVELPLAFDVILAGVRTATVLCIGVTTIASFIGAGGLGELIQNGLRTNDNAITLAGAVPAALLALLADWSLGSLQKSGEKRRLGVPESRVQRIGRLVPVGLFGLLMLGALPGPLWMNRSGGEVVANEAKPKITVGSKEFTESRILAEILVQLGQIAGINTVRGPELGGNLCHQAIVAKKIDIYPEYTGTAYTEILGHKPKSDARAVYLESKREYEMKWSLDFSSPLGFSNGFAMLIRGDEARKLKIKTLSDAVPYAKRWKAGFGPDFITRADGWPGLSKAYGLKLASPPRSLDLGLLNRALAAKQVDLIAGNETDGTIPSLNLFQLKDDKGYFPPYEGVYVLRIQTLKDEPKLLSVLDTLEEAITTEDMQRMNYQVDGLKMRPADVAKEWLNGRGPSSSTIRDAQGVAQ